MALLLNDLLRVVLTPLLIHCRTEPDYALWARVTHIYADEHGAREELPPELEVEKVPAQLRVDLPEDVRGHRKIHAFSPPEVLVTHTLRDQLLLVTHGLEVLVELLIPKHHKDNARLKLLVYEASQLLGTAKDIIASLNFDPRWLLDIETDFH